MDKRTKEYKDSIKEETVEISSNVGDKVETFLEKTGIAKVVKFLAGEDCGCDDRKKKLNAMFTFKVNCLEEDEFNYLDTFFKGNPSVVQPSEYVRICKIAGRVTNRIITPSMGCTGCVQTVVKQMKQIFDTYEA